MWIRPSDMWNETVKQDGKTCKRFFRMDRIERVEKYERNSCSIRMKRRFSNVLSQDALYDLLEKYKGLEG